MIQENELRVGNFLYDYTNKHFQVRQIGVGLIESCGEHIYEIEEVQPIELTEEILLKCGFEYSSKLSYNDCMTYYLHDELEILWLGYLCLDINNAFIPLADTELIYLHQLQNLYWCLCGKELNVNM